MPEAIGSLVSETATPADALASFRSEIAAMHDEEVLTPRVDVASAAVTAIGAMPQIEAHRAQIVSAFGENGERTLDRLVPIARALMIAHATFVAVAERDLEPMAREMMDVRTALFTAASALIERGVVSKKSLGKLVGGQSYQGRAVDTEALILWFRANEATVRGHTKVGEAQLVEAHAKVEEFTTAFAERDRARAGSSPAARDRARTFTLFFRTYERVRRMLTFLRWHDGDVDEIAPSLYAGRSSRKSDAVAAEPTTPTNVVPPGMPGADPFQST